MTTAPSVAGLMCEGMEEQRLTCLQSRPSSTLRRAVRLAYQQQSEPRRWTEANDALSAPRTRCRRSLVSWVFDKPIVFFKIRHRIHDAMEADYFSLTSARLDIT